MWTTGWSLLGTLIYFPFVSIAGAGYHSESKAKEYKHVCKRACQKVCVTCSTVLYWAHRKCLHLAAWALCLLKEMRENRAETVKVMQRQDSAWPWDTATFSSVLANSRHQMNSGRAREGHSGTYKECSYSFLHFSRVSGAKCAVCILISSTSTLWSLFKL